VYISSSAAAVIDPCSTTSTSRANRRISNKSRPSWLSNGSPFCSFGSFYAIAVKIGVILGHDFHMHKFNEWPYTLSALVN
jgi:hypothetical protein